MSPGSDENPSAARPQVRFGRGAGFCEQKSSDDRPQRCSRCLISSHCGRGWAKHDRAHPHKYLYLPPANKKAAQHFTYEARGFFSWHLLGIEQVFPCFGHFTEMATSFSLGIHFEERIVGLVPAGAKLRIYGANATSYFASPRPHLRKMASGA